MADTAQEWGEELLPNALIKQVKSSGHAAAPNVAALTQSAAEEAIWTVAAPVNWPFALSKPGIPIKPHHSWVPSWVVFAAAGDQHGIYQRGISCDLFIPWLINSVSSMCLVKSSMCVLLFGPDPGQASGGWIKYPPSLMDLSCTQGGHKYLCALKSMWDQCALLWELSALLLMHLESGKCELWAYFMTQEVWIS